MLQESANDRERLLSNRGCRVMTQEKERQKLLKALPKVHECAQHVDVLSLVFCHNQHLECLLFVLVYNNNISNNKCLQHGAAGCSYPEKHHVINGSGRR